MVFFRFIKIINCAILSAQWNRAVSIYGYEICRQLIRFNTHIRYTQRSCVDHSQLTICWKYCIVRSSLYGHTTKWKICVWQRTHTPLCSCFIISFSICVWNFCRVYEYGSSSTCRVSCSVLVERKFAVVNQRLQALQFALQFAVQFALRFVTIRTLMQIAVQNKYFFSVILLQFVLQIYMYWDWNFSARKYNFFWRQIMIFGTKRKKNCDFTLPQTRRLQLWTEWALQGWRKRWHKYRTTKHFIRNIWSRIRDRSCKMVTVSMYDRIAYAYSNWMLSCYRLEGRSELSIRWGLWVAIAHCFREGILDIRFSNNETIRVVFQKQKWRARHRSRRNCIALKEAIASMTRSTSSIRNEFWSARTRSIRDDIAKFQFKGDCQKICRRGINRE